MATVGFSNGLGATSLKLDALLVSRPASTFYWVVMGNGSQAHGLRQGDVLVVDRAEPLRHDSLVLARQNGRIVVRTPVMASTGEAEEVDVWGSIVAVIHPVSPAVKASLQPKARE